jgi:uncharacterized protein (DUF2267 family)
VDYPSFITTVECVAGIPREDAERATRATIATLGERLSAGEAQDISEQLPEPLRLLLVDKGKAEGFHLDEFVHRVAEREGVPEPIAERHARAVFAALGGAISPKELKDLASELPKDFEPLLQAAESRSQMAQSEPSEMLSIEDFLTKVGHRAGLDRENARRALEAVLEALADRISGGQVDDLARELPAELRPALERGRAQSGEAARRLSLAEFVKGIAEREGVTPEQAREHARAVFATLREAISEKEFRDITAQLPDEYAALLARP